MNVHDTEPGGPPYKWSHLAGATWSHLAGATLTKWSHLAGGRQLPPDSCSISFTDVQGFTTPADKPVGIVNGATSSRNAVFEERGYLRVWQPTNPVGGTIYVRDLSELNKGFIARDAWGMWTDYPPGDYEVCWGPVAGKTAPPCESVTIVAGQTKIVTGTYS